MPQGLEVYNPDGSLQFSTVNRVYRMIAAQVTGTADGSVNVPGLSAQGTPVVAVTPTATGNVPPSASVSGDTVSWTFSGTPVPNRRDSSLFIGVY